jgi:hypothetical protein
LAEHFENQSGSDAAAEDDAAYADGNFTMMAVPTPWWRRCRS